MNEVRACFDLLTSFHQGNRNIDEWYDVVQAQVNLAKYPPETGKILQRDIFWFFMKDWGLCDQNHQWREMSIYKNSLLVRSDSWLRKWRVPKPPPSTLDRWQETYLWHKFQLMQHQLTKIPAGNYPKRKKTATARQKLQKPQDPGTLHIPETLWSLDAGNTL